MGRQLALTTAEQVKSELALAESCLRDSFQHYLTVGELLSDEKARRAHGEWLPWLAENVEIAEREAQRYMRLAEHREQLEAQNPSGLSDLSIERALKQVSKPKPERPVNVSGELQALAGGRDSSSQPGSARHQIDTEHRRIAEAALEWSPAQERKWLRVNEQLAEALGSLDSAHGEGLAAYAVSDLLSRAAVETRKAAAALDELAFSFGR